MLPTFNIPPIGPVGGKSWGRTQLVFANSSVEVHKISVKKGGFCSHHIHERKWNRFVLNSGSLDVHVQQESGTVDVTSLSPGGVTDVPPGIIHWFEAVEDSDALEIYWVSLDANDIDRRGTEGGVTIEKE